MTRPAVLLLWISAGILLCRPAILLSCFFAVLPINRHRGMLRIAPVRVGHLHGQLRAGATHEAPHILFSRWMWSNQAQRTSLVTAMTAKSRARWRIKFYHAFALRGPPEWWMTAEVPHQTSASEKRRRISGRHVVRNL